MNLLISIIFFSLFFYCTVCKSESYKCIKSAKKYESIYELPNNLLVSVALTESGKKNKQGEFIAWPWTINIKGKGSFFKSKQAVINHVKGELGKGRKNIDMGCMEINHMYHPNAFSNLSNAFDPDKNVAWSANLIKNLYQKYGSWKDAVGYYHSYRTHKKNKYSLKVFNTWRSLNKDDKYAHIKTEDLNLKVPNNTNLDKKYFKIVNYTEPHTVPSIQKKNKPIKNPINSKKNISSTYIIARMEKVRFFRDYFKKD